jgi:large repetitive protein
MRSRELRHEKAGRNRLRARLVAFMLLMLAAFPALAEDCVADLGGVLDGFVTPVPPSQIQIDGDCRIVNYPQSNPLTSNISFLTQPGQTDERWLVVFDNVWHVGNMSCDAVHEHKIWLTNGSLTTIGPNCQNYLIPVEKINKQNPAGQTTAAIGVPFTYRLTIPILFDPATGNTIDFAGSPNDLHSIVITDDLNATGADLTYVSHNAYWASGGQPVAHSFSNVGGLLTFTLDPSLVIPAETQIVIELTVVLDDSPANALGTQFINTAKWQFGRLIDSVFYAPLPGEWGITPPMTIVAPNLVVTKSGPATMNLGTAGQFVVDVLNDGTGDAWGITLVDRLPSGPTGGMCDVAPEILSVTLGGTPLTQGTGYALSYTGAPSCELTLNLLDSAGAIGSNEHLIVTYRSRLDGDTENGATLTNVAGVTRWYNGPSSAPDRVSYSRSVTTGTVGTLDHQDAHTVTASLFGFFFEKTVTNLRSGENPATVAAPGDTLRYSLRLRSTTDALNNFTFRDDLDALNAPAAFVPGTLSTVGALPPGAVNNSNPTGGSKGTGLIDIASLNLAAGQQIVIQFDIRVAPTVNSGAIVANQSQLLVNGAPFMVSDDPNVNGQADPFIAGDEDPTRVVIALPTLQFQKTVLSGAPARPGDVVRYRLQLRNVSNIPFSGFSLIDEIDRLNSAAMFVPGTLTLVSALPAGATNNSNASGGSRGSGLLDLRNLSIGVAGTPNDTLTIELTAQLAPVIDNGTVVLNQAQLMVVSSELMRSDDPSVGGTQDPTRLLIASAPVFRILKNSQDMTGDPNVLRAGERLRYTITVKNIGNDNATDVRMRDQIPANTTYVAGSTTLNGALVPDASGVAPLVNAVLISTPENSTPGTMRADASATTSNVATITFDVIVNPTAIDGTVISNQAFVSAQTDGVVDYPSDDPETPILNDPTRDVVGYQPLLYADKRAALQVDNGTAGVVDPGDVLRYTITVYNTGTIAATGAVLRDQVPANTTYVADSVTLNGLPVGQPDGGVSPLVAGVNVSSSDLTPPVPSAGQGTLSPNQSAVVQFDLRVNSGVPAGTVISNQAVVRTTQVPDLPTDGDGNPATGPEPTVVVVGPGQRLSITKQVAVVGGGPALAGGTLEYLVRVTNVSAVPATYVEITDDLDANVPGQLTFVADTATLNGSNAGINIVGSVLTASYYATYGPLAPGQTAVLRFRAYIAQSLAIGTRVTNSAEVRWNDPPMTARASVSIDLGGIVGVGILSGTAWHDANFNKGVDAGERLLDGWTVELYRNGRVVYSTQTDSNGTYRISGVTPNYATEDRYELRFLAPAAGPNTAKLGRADSGFTNDLQRIYDIVVQAGSNLQNLNLPIEPNGVIYNSMSRLPIPGVTLTLLQAGSRTPLPESCFDDPAQQNQVSLANGYYRFDLNFADPACASGGSFIIDVAAPAVYYVAGYSQIIPPTAGAAGSSFSVPSCPATADDAIPATLQRCEVQGSALPPATSIRPRSAGTRYHVQLSFDDSLVPGSSQVFNNHIPLDPVLNGALAITKTTPLLNVTRGQLVPYTITVRNVVGMPLQDVRLADRFPAGFHYVPGSAHLDGVKAEPTTSGRELYWSDLSFDSTEQHTLTLLLAVGAGVSEGEFVNRAQVVNAFTGNTLSGEASATVRVVPDPTFDCTDVTGKVFDDFNRNGMQDAGEQGLPGVRLVTTRGLVAITDAYGRFHITCAATPREGRGSNFALKLDDRTLPSGYRSSTDQLVVQRATAGKMLRFNFGASIHRSVSLDLADAVFEPGTTEIRLQWKPRMDLLLAELRKAPSVLRISYLADVEDEQLVERRLNTVKQQIMDAWKAADSGYALNVEPEVFWRRGGPPRAAGRPGAGR